MSLSNWTLLVLAFCCVCGSAPQALNESITIIAMLRMSVAFLKRCRAALKNVIATGPPYRYYIAYESLLKCIVSNMYIQLTYSLHRLTDRKVTLLRPIRLQWSFIEHRFHRWAGKRPGENPQSYHTPPVTLANDIHAPVSTEREI